MSHYFATLVFFTITFFSYSQVTVTHSVLNDINLCDTSSNSLLVVNTTPFLATDTLYFYLNAGTGFSTEGFTSTSGTLNASGDTLFVTNIGGASTFLHCIMIKRI